MAAAVRWEPDVPGGGSNCQSGRPGLRSRWSAWHPALGGGATPNKAYAAFEMNVLQISSGLVN